MGGKNILFFYPREDGLFFKSILQSQNYGFTQFFLIVFLW